MRNNRTLIALATALVIAASCQSQRETRLPPEQENLVLAYIAMAELADAWPAHHPVFLDSSQKILNAYGLTKESYESGLAYFDEEPERWESFYARVIEHMEAAEANAMRPQETTSPSQRPPVRRPNRSAEAARR